MDKLTQFFNKLDKAAEHLGKRKKLYMTIFTVLAGTYMMFEVKPGIINLELILAFIIALTPSMMIVSIMIDGIAYKGTILYKKLATGFISYLAIYSLLIATQSIVF